jgi:protein TonB
MQKVIVAMAIAFSLSSQANCQVADDAASQRKEMIFTKVEVEAQFKGGDAAWRNFIQNNLLANTPMVNSAPTGSYTVIVKFVVSRTGTVGAVIAETNHGFGMEAEAIRLIKKTPKWIAAINGGHIVSSYRRQPVTFVVP